MNTEVFTANQKKGKWTQAEHEKFLEGFDVYGDNWHMNSTIVTTRTFTQIKTYAQKYHAENNAEVQRKYREHLLPDAKTDIQKNDTAAHQKRRQSLSPDTKAHMLTWRNRRLPSPPRLIRS